MSYDDIINSSVAAEFDALLCGRDYCILPSGHQAYAYPIIERRDEMRAWGIGKASDEQ